MPTLVIGNKNYSSWSLRPWLLLRQFGVPFEEVRILLDTPEFKAQVAAWAPNGRVPALRDGDLAVWDSLAICEYINERYLDGRGWPADLATRAHARAAVAEMHSGFAALRTQLPMNMRRTPDAYRWDGNADRDIARVQQLWRDLRAWHGGSEATPGRAASSQAASSRDFLCGDFGIVDAMFAPVVSRFVSYGVPMDANAQAFADAIQALPAWREWRDAAAAEVEALEATDHVRA